jgi:hypothetical protein
VLRLAFLLVRIAGLLSLWHKVPVFPGSPRLTVFIS